MNCILSSDIVAGTRLCSKDKRRRVRDGRVEGVVSGMKKDIVNRGWVQSKERWKRVLEIFNSKTPFLNTFHILFLVFIVTV